MLQDVFFAPLLQAIQVLGIIRGGAAVDDVSLVLLAILRVLENSKTGRDFIQTHGIPTNPSITRQDKEELRCGATKGRSTLMVYDSAIIDFQHPYNLKQSTSIYVLTAWKDNLVQPNDPPP